MCSIGGMILTGDTEVLGGTSGRVPLRPPQIPHGLFWDRTWNSAERCRRLTAWDVALPKPE